MPGRSPRRQVGGALLSAALVLAVCEVLVAAPARAEDPVVIIESPPVEAGTGTETPLTVSTIQVGETQTITVSNPGGTSPTTQECVGVQSTTGYFCLGTSEQAEDVTVSSAATQQFRLPGDSMDWIVDEGVAVIAGVHGVAGDDLVRAFARPEIRAYVYSRIQAILNKKLYGEPLSPQEQAVYDEVEAIFLERLTESSATALAEYDAWSRNPCGYQPPAPPAGSGLSAVPNPVAESTTCHQAGARFALWEVTRGTPPVSSFDAWASYRNPSLSLQKGGDPLFLRMGAKTIMAAVHLTSLSAAVSGGLLASSVITISAKAAEAIIKATAVGAHVVGRLLAKGGSLSAAMIGGAVGLAVGVVVAVLAAVVTLALTIWQIVEDAAPGNEIRRRAAEAAANTDPLGIEASIPDYADLEIDDLEEPDDKLPTNIHTEAFAAQLLAIVNEWMMFDSSGNLVPDPTSGYTVTESEPGDVHFVDDNTDEVQSSIVVKAPPGVTNLAGQTISGYQVLFSRGFLMVSEVPEFGSFGPYQPRLSLGYLKPDGTPATMTIARLSPEEGAAPERKFQLTTAAPDGFDSETSDTWTFQSSAGVVRTVTLQESTPALPQVNVVPSVEGVMVADNQLTFDANLSTPGQGTGGTYAWTIDRLDSEGAVVESKPIAGSPVRFQHRVDEPGDYRARVVYQRPGEPDVAGSVEFHVVQPDPTLVASIHDDRVLDGKIFLDLRMTQNTRADEFEVEVAWADDGLGNEIVETYTVNCVNTGFDTCDTGPLVAPDSAPTNPQWSSSPSYRIPDDQNFLPHVRVTVTNGYGAVLERTFPVVGEHRPTYATMTPYAQMPAGVASTVDVVEVFPSPLLVESQDLTILPYVQTIAAQLPPGLQPSIQQKPDGRWFLQLVGYPQADVIGPHTFYFPFEQEPNGSGLRPAPALATVEVVAAVEPGYRAILRGTSTELIGNYRNEYPDYHVQVAQVLADEDDDFTPFTGTVMCKLEAGPLEVFDKPCQADAPFPWPAERYSDALKASVYVESTTQPISADGAYSVQLFTRFVDPILTKVASPLGSGHVRFELDLWDPGAILPPFTDYDVDCSIDGAAFSTCLSTGVIDIPVTFGPHTLDVRVTAPDGAATTVRGTWDGGPAPAPPPLPELGATVSTLPAAAGDLLQEFRLTLTHGSGVPAPFSARGYAVVCSRDGGAIAPCFDDGTFTARRVPGPHRLTVRVTAPGGATLVREVAWSVATPKARFKVTAPGGTHARGDKVTIRASRLLPQERYVVKIDGIKVAGGKASADGKVKEKVKVPTKAGRGSVEVQVTGATRKRLGTDTLVVSRGPTGRVLVDYGA